MDIRRISLHVAVAVLAPVLISACAGGGDSSTTTTSTLEWAPPASSPARSTETDQTGLYTNSYMNLKGIWTTEMPPQVNVGSYPNVFGKFDSSGHVAMFSAVNTYTAANTSSASEATPAEFFFSRWNDTTQAYDRDSSMIVSPTSAAACTDVRKPLVADFNKDGISDVFVSCIGWTHAPYPGETNRLVLSRNDGRFDIVDVPAVSRAFTSATASDLDSDGDVDVILLTDTSDRPLQVLLNDGQGQFTLETSHRMPLIGHGYYTVEMADVNGDDKLDLLVGGHEMVDNRPTQVYLNPGDNLFISATPLTLPKSTDAQGADVLDFAVSGPNNNRTLWVMRSSHSGHVGRVVQRVSWSELNAGTATYNAVFTDTDGNAHWITPAHKDGANVLVSDDPAMTDAMLQTPTLTQLP